MSKGRGTKIVIKFNKPLLGDVVGNHTAFTVTGMQRNPLFHGALQLKQYAVASVTRYPDTDDTILLSFNESNRFNDAEGDLTVAYNQAIGNLTGTRAVESFSQAFTPEDLEPTPHHEHTISVEGTNVLVDLKPVTYVVPQHNHTISVQGTGVTVTLIHVDDIPP